MKSKKPLSSANYSYQQEGIYTQKNKDGTFTLWEGGAIVGEGTTIEKAKASYQPPLSYEDTEKLLNS